MAVTVGQKAAIYLASPPAVTFAAEATTPDAARLTYTITNAAKRYWDKDTAVTVERSTDAGVTWAAVPASQYTLQHVGGKVIFGAAQAVGTLIRVSGSYLPVSQLAEAREWSLDTSVDTVETTTLGAAWKTQAAILRSASVKLSRWWVDSWFLDQLANRLVVVLYVDSAVGSRYEGYARLKADSVKVAAAGLVEEDLSLELEGDLYYVAA